MHCAQSLVEMGSHELFAQADISYDPPDLCFLGSWDYRQEPLHPVVGHNLIGALYPKYVKNFYYLKNIQITQL
jgi:hypothetical protein